MLRTLMILLLLLPLPAMSDLYTERELDEAHASMGQNIELTIKEDIVFNAPRHLRPEAAKIQVEFLYSASHPLNFFSDPAAGKVYVPMTSVKFIDDLAMVQAWFESKKCDPTYVQTYLWSLLRKQRELPSPMVAFGIKLEDAKADSYVWDVSGKILKSSLLFILSHEVGHVVLGHKGGLSGPYSQRQELEADQFAMDHFAAIGQVPSGMAMYFTSVRWFDQIGEDAIKATHPVSPKRLQGIAKRLKASPELFSFSEPDGRAAIQRTQLIAAEIEKIVMFSSDEEMLTILPIGLERDFPLSQLHNACPP